MEGSSSVRILNGKEKEDLIEALPAEWVKPASLGKVFLYQNPISPPCAKLRMVFEFYGVDYQCYKGPRKGSEYKKIPVIVFNNVQINDSFIILKSLAKILDGVPLSPELLELEEMTTFGVMIAMEARVANDSAELSKVPSQARSHARVRVQMCIQCSSRNYRFSARRSIKDVPQLT